MPIMATVAKVFGIKDRARVACKVVAGPVGPYSDPGRTDFWFADADVWSTTRPGRRARVFASGATLADALRRLADEIDSGEI